MSQSNGSRYILFCLIGFTAGNFVVQSRRNDRQDVRIGEIERRSATKKAIPAKPVATPVQEVPPPPAVGDVVQLQMEEVPVDEQYRDMTVLSSATHLPGAPCMFTRLREELTVREVRGDYVVVQYALHGTQDEIARQRRIWFPTTRNFCANGDVGVMEPDDYRRYQDYHEMDAKIGDEQRRKLAHMRALFPELATSSVEGL